MQVRLYRVRSDLENHAYQILKNQNSKTNQDRFEKVQSFIF